MLTMYRQNPSLLEHVLQETVNKATKNMATIDHYQGGKMKHM